MIEQFIQAIGSIIRSRKVGNYDQALEQIQFVSQKFLDTDISSFLKYTPDQIIAHFQNESGLDTHRAIICADLLNELSMICSEKQYHDLSYRLKVLCVNLYVSVIPIDKYFQTKKYMEKAENLINEISKKDIHINVAHYHKFLRENNFN